MTDRTDIPTDRIDRSACDATDRELIALLLKDVRATNRALAAALGVSEWVVANRLRRLRDDNVLAASLVVDWRLAGYELSGFALIRADRGQAERIAERLGRRADMQSVSRTLGGVDLIAHVLATDLSALRRTVDEVGAMRGVAGVEMLTAVEFHRYVFERMPLPVPRWNPDDFADKAFALDALDRQIMRCLIEDGHQSNREIARQTGVSENTIRGRLRRLEDSGLMRVIVMVDPFAFGDAAVGYMAMRCAGGRRDEVASAVATRGEVAGLISCLGSYDLVAVAVADSLQALARLIEDLHAVPGVETLTQFPIVGRPLHRFHLARLL
jgi:Lrp/AsnC family transcriptional regulator, regulator for asnA, asnC and gidA